MKRITFLLMTFFYGLCSLAQTIECVYTKDGAEYEGYISEQIPGKTISVYANKIIFTVSSKDVRNFRSEARPVCDMSEVAKEWFQQHIDSCAVELCSFSWNNKSVEDVYCFSRQGDKASYIGFGRKTYKLEWKDVEKTVKIFNKDIPYGLFDIVTLNNGERYQGKILEQTRDGGILFGQDDGIKHSFTVKDIVSLSIKPVDSSIPVWKQSYFLDRLVLDNATVDGLIISRIIGNKTIKFMLKDGEEVSYEMNKIKGYRKVWNVDYVEYIPPVPDNASTITVNDEIASLIWADAIKDIICISTPLSAVTNVKVGKPVKIVLHNYKSDSSLNIYKTKKIGFFSSLKYRRFDCQYFKINSIPKYELKAKNDKNGDIVYEFKPQASVKYYVALNGFNRGLLLNAE